VSTPMRPAGELLGRELSSAVVMFHQAVAERLGLNATDFRAVEILGRLGPVTAGRLAEETGLSTGAITGVLDRLERTGYVRRERDPGDRRRVIIHVVPDMDRKGEVTEIFARLYRTMAAQMEEYDQGELALITDFLQRTIQVLQQETAQLTGEEPVAAASP
jgi:DNA-binding MarR family transcriptional regulator